jgi:hypothetical protein
MTCDDKCLLSIASCPDKTSPLTKLIEHTSHSSYRDFWGPSNFVDGGRKTWSEWIELKKANHYYLEGSYAENGGSDHFSVAVEIEQSTIKGHHHAMKEIQELSALQEVKLDTTRITITNPDDNEYVLVYKNPKNVEKTIASSRIKGKSSAWDFNKAVRKFYSDTLKSNIDVKRTFKDAAGLDTTDSKLATQYIYTITVKKMITGVSTNSITFVKVKASSLATAKIELPSEIGQSAPPIQGSYKVKCVDKNGAASMTNDIKFNNNWYWSVYRIMTECAGLYDKLEALVPPNQPEYQENGFKIRFRFTGLNENPGQFEIVKSDSDPLTGTDIKYTAETVYPYGTNLFYNPIPFEFLKTYEEKPQLIVKVGGQPAVCHNMTCDFTYTEPHGEITKVTYDKTSKKMVITGTNLPGKAPAAAPAADTCKALATETLCTADATCAWANAACAKKSGRRRLSTANQLLPGWDVKQEDKDLLKVHNDIRMNPKSFVPKLEAMLPKFSGKTYDGKLLTQEGAPAV